MPIIEQGDLAASLPRRFDLDVCLNGGRGHVEALQMLPQAAVIIGASSPTQAFLQTAAIRRMTNREISCIVNPDALNKAACIGVASFMVSTEIVEIGFLERETVAARRELQHRIVYRALAAEPELSQFDYSQMRSFEDLIVLIIHSVKLFHQSRYPGASDIRFTSCRGGNLPLTITPAFETGVLHISPLRSLKLRDAVQTNSAVRIEAASGQNLNCVIGFSYVSGGPS